MSTSSRPSCRTYAEAASLKPSNTVSQPLSNISIANRNAPAVRLGQAASHTTGMISGSQIATPSGGKEKENTVTRIGRQQRPTEKVLAPRIEREEVAHRQERLEANCAERARRQERKHNRVNGIDRPAEIDDEERPDNVFTSEAVVAKPTTKATLVRRQGKVPPPAAVDPAQSFASPACPSYQCQPRSPSRSLSPPQGRRMPIQSPTHFVGEPENLDVDDNDNGDSFRRSPSPAASHIGTRKRARSPDDNLDVVNLPAKVQKVAEGTGRPKASDYDDVSKEVILTATSIYRCLISTSNAFPTASEEAELIRLAWDRANAETVQDVPIAITSGITKVISARGSQIRGEVKTRAANYVEILYGFDSGHGKSIIKKNRELAEALKKNNSGYLYKDYEAEHGLYQNPIIQKIVNKSWFNNSRDEGILYADLFDPLSVEAIALVLTTIECGIDGWANGVNVEVSFYGTEYKALYLRHVQTLNAFGIATSKHDLLGKLQRSLFNFGRVHSGVPSTISRRGPLLLEAAFTAAMKEYEEDSGTEEDGEDVD